MELTLPKKRTLVFTVGQEALDAIVRWRTKTEAQIEIVPLLALHPTESTAHVAAPWPVAELFTELTALRPGTHRVGVAYGVRSRPLVTRAKPVLARLGIEVLAVEVGDGRQAVSAIARLSDRIDALWLPPDADVVTPQVFSYALALQQRRGIPLVANTEEQVRSGALIAADLSPREVGRYAAEVANRWLAPPSRRSRSRTPPPAWPRPRVHTNELVARRLGISP